VNGVLPAELVKQRRPRTYVALGLMALIPLITAIALHANPPGPPRDIGDLADAFTYLATRSGPYLGVAALNFFSRFLLVVVIAVFAGDAIASEASWGNLRALLARPIPRNRLLGAKLASATTLAFLGAMLIPVAGVVIGTIVFGWHPVDFAIVGLHQSAGRVTATLGLASLYVFWSLAWVLAAAFMFSTMSDSPAGAVFGSVGLYVFSQILDGIDALGSIRDGLPTHYLDSWTHMFTHTTGPTADMLRGTLLQIPYVAVFLGVAWWWFNRKDILS
jgi:ABC-2 type transport system permease protein